MHTPSLAKRIWSGPVGPEPQTRLFRRTFILDVVPTEARLRLFAEMRYGVWLNGVFLGRGPIFRHPHHLVLDPYDVTSLLRPGENVLAAVVHTPNLGVHNGIPTGHPGLLAELTWQDANGRGGTLVSDESWRVTDRTGWTTPTPKRCWALAHVEVFDAAQSPGAGWREPGFDDRAWSPAAADEPTVGIPNATLYDRPLPNLRYAFVAPRSTLRIESTAAPVQPTTPQSPIGKQLEEAGWQDVPSAIRVQPLAAETGATTITGLTPDRGVAIHVDLDRYRVGQPVLELASDSAGVIDLGWSEEVADGRPILIRKGVSYVDRIHAQPGSLAWHPINFSGMRYLTLVLRGFTGSVRITRFGVMASEPDLAWEGSFHCSDDKLNAIFEMCKHTLRVGTQEGLMDCPTREQAPYVGDGHPVAEWLAQLTGDFRHWAYLTKEQFGRPSANGLIRSSPFSWRGDSLIDYTFVGILGTRDYLRATGDRDLVAPLMPAARGVLAWWESQRNADGLFGIDWRDMKHEDEFENCYDPAKPIGKAMNLFIDHPGMGWHNQHEPGIDRRGVNCAVNAFWAQACRAMAELEEAVGDPARAQPLRERAAELARKVGERFFDSKRNRFADGVLDGKQHEQISEQTNTWAVASGACDDETAARVMSEIVADRDSKLARSGPYFWTYMFPEMVRHGQHAQALDAARERWWPMVEDGGCLWETFAGDDLDSRCHPWSGAVLSFLLHDIAGLPRFAHSGDNTVVLRPRVDLLREARAVGYTKAGRWAIAWRREGHRVRLEGVAPEGCTAEVRLGGQSVRAGLAGPWVAWSEGDVAKSPAPVAKKD